jgi:hypothetical protein
MRTYYNLLGVSEDASLDEIKKSYRALAREYHPDVNKTLEAEEKFKEINKAYETLSDSLKRADYDHSLHQEAYIKERAVWDKKLLYAAYLRVSAYIFTFALAGFILEWFAWWIIDSGEPFSPNRYLGGILAGFFIGLFWGADMNFKVETFLGPGKLGRMYSFLRTIMMSLGAAYLLSIIGSLFDQYLFQKTSTFTVATIILGIIIGSTIGSDGDTIEKIRSNQGRFNLFYTLLRGLEIGAAGLGLGLLIGLIFTRFGEGHLLIWMALTGFILGDILGSVAPSNLAAYASYASAYVTSIIIILIILGTLIIGLIFGSILGDTISQSLSGFFQNIWGG